MKKTSSTALLPDWYVDFQAVLLRQAPRPGEIDRVTAEGWTNNQKSLKNELAGCLVPPSTEIHITSSETDEEKILEDNRHFLTGTFIKWYNETGARKARQSVNIISPKDIDWISLEKDIDKSKFGEYTMNFDTAKIDWKSIHPEKIKIFNFSEFIEKPRPRPRLELAKYLAENYSDKYHIPGIEYWKYLIENEDKIPKKLKDGNYYFFFGSILRQKGGWNAPGSCYRNVPSSYWDGRQWYRGVTWLSGRWTDDDRVLLLEK